MLSKYQLLEDKICILDFGGTVFKEAVRHQKRIRISYRIFHMNEYIIYPAISTIPGITESSPVRSQE